MRQPHAAKHVRRFGELNIIVADDLDAVTPGIAEVEKWTRQRLDACFGKRLAGRLLVIDDQAKMTAVVEGLSAAFLERKKLVAKIDESRGLLFLLRSPKSNRRP
jgi:hypothetical protein